MAGGLDARVELALEVLPHRIAYGRITMKPLTGE